MQPVAVNAVAFALAVLAKFVLGSVWYSPVLLGKAWQAEIGCTPEQVMKRMRVALPVELVGTAITAFVLLHAIRYAGANSAVLAAAVGFLNWLGFVAVPSAGYVAFGSRSLKLTLIDNGYHLIGLLLMGAILGMWR
jgi:hypothetical protein